MGRLNEDFAQFALGVINLFYLILFIPVIVIFNSNPSTFICSSNADPPLDAEKKRLKPGIVMTLFFLMVSLAMNLIINVRKYFKKSTNDATVRLGYNTLKYIMDFKIYFSSDLHNQSPAAKLFL